MDWKGRLICLLLLGVFAAFPASAVQIYHSNSIGQIRGPAQDLQPEGWFLVVEGKDSSLYQDGVVVQKTTRSTDQEQVVLGDGSFVTRRYQDSRLISETSVSLDTTRNTNYFYDAEHRLQEYTVTENENLLRIVRYYHAIDGSVSAIKTIDFSGELLWEYVGQDWYSQGTDQMYVKLTRLPGNIIVKDTYTETSPIREVDVTYSDTGDIIVTVTDDTSGKQETTYSEAGNIVQETQYIEDIPTATTDYQYDETGSILTTVKKDLASGRTVLQTFSDGKLISEQVEEGPVLVKIVVYHDDGTRTETLYDEGEPYADVVYASDGKRVLSVSYR